MSKLSTQCSQCQSFKESNAGEHVHVLDVFFLKKKKRLKFSE